MMLPVIRIILEVHTRSLSSVEFVYNLGAKQKSTSKNISIHYMIPTKKDLKKTRCVLFRPETAD